MKNEKVWIFNFTFQLVDQTYWLLHYAENIQDGKIVRRAVVSDVSIKQISENTFLLPSKPTSEEIFLQATQLEEKNDYYQSAINAYENIVQFRNEEKSILPQVLLRLGSCYQKRGELEKSRAEYVGLIENYPDEKEYVGEAVNQLVAIKKEKEQKEAALDKELSEKWVNLLDNELREYLIRSEKSFIELGLVYPLGYFDFLSAEERDRKEKEWLSLFPGPRNLAHWQAIEALGTIRSQKAVKPLLDIATEMRIVDNRSRYLAVKALGRIGDKSVVPELIHLIDHYNANTRKWAQASLARLTGQYFGDAKEKWGDWWNEQGDEPKYISGKEYPKPEGIE